MTLPASGTIAFSTLNVEIARASTATTNLNETIVRTLFVKPTAGSAIALSDGYGKTYRKKLAVSYATSVANPAILNLNSISGYVAGVSDITITISSGAVLYSTSTATAALRITGGTAGDTLKIINNGAIAGRGGNGGGTSGSATTNLNATNGGPAINSTFYITSIAGTGYLGGGGGGGGGGSGGGPGYIHGGGGGGAGGGNGGSVYTSGGSGSTAAGGAGATGATGNGSNGILVAIGLDQGGSGGGGGRVFPGGGGTGSNGSQADFGDGGGAGGGGGGGYYGSGIGAGGGGGGWGQAGGSGKTANTTNTQSAFSGSNSGGGGGAAGSTPTLTNTDATYAGGLGGAAVKHGGSGAPGTVSCTVYGAYIA